MRRNGKEDLFNDDGMIELLAALMFLGAIVAFIAYMVAVWNVPFTSVLTRILGMFFGVIVSLYTIGFVFIGIIVLLTWIDDTRKKGVTIRRILYLISIVVFFFLGHLFFNYLFWGIVYKSSSIALRCIPALVVTIPAAWYFLHYIAYED